jgi:hypothetical protein
MSGFIALLVGMVDKAGLGRAVADAKLWRAIVDYEYSMDEFV